MTKKFLCRKRVLASLLAFLLSSAQFSVFAQNSNQTTGSSAMTEISSSSAESQELSSNSSNQNSNLSAQNWNWSSGGELSQSQPSSIGLFFRMVFALALVLAAAYLAIRVLKRGTKLSNSDDPFLRHVSHLALSASRSVDVVTILDHAYILGVSDNAVNLVGEITDQELVNSMNLYADKNDNTKRPRSFNDILNIFMPGGGAQSKGENVFGSSAWNASESLRRQRERLNENEEGGE